MKRLYKIIITVFCIVCIGLSLSGCFYSFEESQDGKFSFGVSSAKQDAFCIGYNWSGGDTSFVIPDEFMGYRVTTLGGYTGRGYPCPFGVSIDLNTVYLGDGSYGAQKDISEKEGSDEEYDVLKFSVHLGANLVNLDYIDGKTYYVRHIEKENGEFDTDVLCKVVYFFTVDEGNPKLYAENGKLFYRDNNEPVNDFFYE